MYIDFKRLGKKVLRILACVISAFLLLWGGATLYLKITQNYNAVSPADCVARIIMRNGRDWRGTITHYGDTLEEIPLTDTYNLKRVQVTFRGQEQEAFYIGSPTLFGRRYLSPSIDYSFFLIGSNTLQISSDPDADNSGALEHQYVCYVLRYAKHTVLMIESDESMTDTLTGEPIYVADGGNVILGSTNGETRFYFFVIPPLEELPEDYCIQSENMTIRKQTLDSLLKAYG